jgi:hypothetical protein
MKKQFFAITLLLMAVGLQAYGQFTIDGQILQRSEYRHGFGKLISEGQDPAIFLAHRARLQALYEMKNFTFYMSIQDVRTWGNSSQVKATDPYLSVHEAWAQVKLGENWSLKLGRQELNYDNYRFLGNLDWALQGRAHDFALAKYEKGNAKFHFGGAYNQDAQTTSGNLFTTPNQYKVAQMARYENLWGNLQFSALFWNDGRQYFRKDNNGQVIEKDVFFRQTIGIPTLKYIKGNSQISGFFYLQSGKDPVGRTVSAHNVSLAFNQKLGMDAEKGSGWTLSAGFEILSGTASDQTDKNKSYNPLYGTNHLFNGYMDLFYVANAHENTVGLQDYFIRSRYAFNKKLFFQGDYHAFLAAAKVLRQESPGVWTGLDSSLGSEVDLSMGWILNDAVSIQGGYSQFFKTNTMAYIQGSPNLQNTQNWAYLMFIFRPTMKNKFIGILL